jgi:3-(3-hydroxy-phenyl)propionate hydroxylase
MKLNSKNFDICIVGYGPTGATLANLIAQCGLSVVVIEREADMYKLPRAVHFDGETMRVFQSLGIADQLSKKVRINPGMRFVDQKKSVILDWPRPQEIGVQGWHSSYRLHQPDLEHLLRKKLSSYANATVISDTEVVALSEDKESVEVTCRRMSDGSKIQLNTKYVVGCDGANSVVRRLIGSDMEDLGFKEKWLVVDLLLKRERPDLGDHSIQFCDPIRPMTYCRNPENRRRWEITMLEGETDEDVTKSDMIWKFLAPWITTDDADLERKAVYTFKSLLAHTWRKGRLMIAGDAAHLTPPFMGQGMCAGIRDAVNLAWKLVLRVNGDASDGILDSYQQERAPNVREFIETAIRLGGLINTMDSEKALAQSHSSPNGSARMSSLLPPLGASNLDGLISGSGPHCGKLFTQPILKSGKKLDNEIGYSPVLIVRNKLPENIIPKVPVLDGETHPNLIEVLKNLDASAVLVRPDRYIADSAKSEHEVKKLAVCRMPIPLSNKIKEREINI